MAHHASPFVTARPTETVEAAIPFKASRLSNLARPRHESMKRIVDDLARGIL